MKKGMTPGFRLISFLFVLILVYGPSPVISATLPETSENDIIAADQQGDDEEELANLIQILDKYTEIATKTKLNVDFVPGMVTVLYGEDLEVRGIQNVWEALKLVPGMDIGLNTQGLRHVLVRGIGDTIASGNLKFQLNGISMNSALWGKAYPMLDMPVEQIDRIEIIRGPGSAVHGEFASTGVVNVITRKEGKKITAGVGEHNSYSGSVLYSLANPDKEIDFSLNVSGFRTDGARVMTGPDQLYALGMSDLSNAPGPTNEARDYNSAILEFSFRNIAFTGYYLNEGNGDHFGFIGTLPPPHNNIAFRFKNYGGQLQSEIDLSESLHVDSKLGFFQHRFSSALNFEQPPGFAGSYPDGMFVALFYLENRLDGELDVTYRKWKNHIIIFGLAFANTEIDKAWHDKNYVPSTGETTDNIVRYTGTENWLTENKERGLFNLTFQDEINISESFTLTGGLRYDRYSDVGSELSPRIAAVWRITREHILKTQFARAFCPPTFNQLYAKNNPYLVGNTEIEPETIDTMELSYIYHTYNTVGKAAYFYSSLDNLISAGGGTYSNTGSTHISGVEIELEHQLMDKLKLDSNISYSHSKNNITGDAIPGVAEWLGDLGIIFEPSKDLTINVQYGYVGKRSRSVTDTRNELTGYHTVDTSISLYNLFVKGLTLRAGIKNILDEDVYYPSPEYLYPGDYPRPGREWWVKFVYEF